MNIPSELQRSIPREVRLTAAGKLVTVVVGLLAAAAVIVPAWLYVLAERGRAADAAAVDTRGRVIALGATRDDHPRWLATYEFSVDGRRHEATSRLGRRDRQRVAVGEVVTVRYLPADPGTSWVDGFPPDRVPPFVPPVVFAGMAAAAIALGLTIRKQRWLLAGGRPAVATVTGAKRVSRSHSHSNRVTFEFHLLSGALAQGRIELQKKPEFGSEMIVLYDPETPSRCARYPLALVRISG